MRRVVNHKNPDIYITAQEVMDRYGISKHTLARWIKQRGFPEPRKIVHKRHFLIADIEAWDCEQAGIDDQGDDEKAMGMPIVSGLIKNYEEFVQAMTDRRSQLGMSAIELDALSGMQEGYANKLENWRKDYGKGLGPDIFPLWLGGLRVGVILVDLPRRPRKQAVK